jgi:hypothetical protein
MRTGLEGFTPEQVTELAEAYIDLVNTMNEALEVCETGYGFFSWSRSGYEITLYPPPKLVEAIVEATT